MCASTTRAVVCLLSCWLVACAAPSRWRYEEALVETPATAQHALHEARLRALMRDLERLRHERLPRAFDLEELESGQKREASAVARALAASAERIGSAAPTGLDESERLEFGALSAQLEQQTLRLVDEIPSLSVDRLRARLAEIDDTCERCHARYRIPR